MDKILIGCDPEVCLISQDGLPYSSEGLLGGLKDSPRKTRNGYIQEDGVLAEYNIPPASSPEEFALFNKLVLQDLSDIIKPLDLNIDFLASAHYREEQLHSRQATTAGCDPDFDAWLDCMNEKPDITATTLRSLGGHLHVSVPGIDNDYDKRLDVIKAMDFFLGIPSVLMDKDTERRKLYGKAGCFRPKFTRYGDPYDGVEYRTLSNFWLKSEELMKWAFVQTVKAVESLDFFNGLLNSGEISQDRIVNTINNADRKSAESLCHSFNLPVLV